MLELVDMKESIEKAKYGDSFLVTQKDTLDTKQNLVEKYYETMKNITIQEKIDLVLHTIGVSSDNILYAKMLSLFKLIPMLVPLTQVVLIGEKGMGKSFIYEKIFGEIPHGELPSLAELRGDKREEILQEKGALYDRNILIFEEVSDLETNKMDSLSSLKTSMESGNFLRGNKIDTQTKVSIIYIGNEYTEVKEIECLKDVYKKTTFPKKMKDEAFCDRFALLLPHYRSVTRDIKFCKKGEEGMFAKEFIQICSEIKLLPLDLEKIEEALSKEQLESLSIRDKRESIKSTAGLVKLFYGKEIPKKSIISGIWEWAIHFRKLFQGIYHSPVNKFSQEFINEVLGGSKKFLYVLDNRILYQNYEQNLLEKIAWNSFGGVDNLLELKFSKEHSNRFLLEIEHIEKDGEISVFKNISLETSNLENEEINDYKLQIYEKSILLSELSYITTIEKPKFKSLPTIFKNMILEDINREYGINLREIAKRDIYFDGDTYEWKLINFTKLATLIYTKLKGGRNK